MADSTVSRPHGATTIQGAMPNDFSDRRVFVVSTNCNASWLVHPRDYLGAHQQCDGPTYIMVGPDVSDEKLLRNLEKISERYGVTLEQMQAARDTKMHN